MIVVQQHKALALTLKSPSRILKIIPTARVLKEANGKSIVVTPHKMDEVKILRNLGISAPAPILYYYNWSGHYKPYEHQRMTAAFLTMNRKALVLNEIGTGKTESALWAADYLMEIGAIKKCLIISPLSTLEAVWGDSIFKDFSHRKGITLHGAAERRKRLLAIDVDFYIINHDGLKVVSDETMNMFDLIIVDEAAVFRNTLANRYKHFLKWMEGNKNSRLWLMTGTPTPNSPVDAYALAKLIGNSNIPSTMTAFRDLVCLKVGNYKWVPRPKAMEIVQEILQPAVRYSRDECPDLPNTVFQTRKVMLTKEQKDNYDKMFKHFVTDVNEGNTITAVNEAVKLQKLVQIACGVAYGEDGKYIELDCIPRVNAVKEVIEEAGHKVIIFVPLTGTLKMLERELAKYWTIAIVNGSVSSTKRNEIFQNFQNTKDPHVLIAHPATMAHGLTLTAASTIIWYGPIVSNEQYVQANGRIERIGKRYVANVVHIEATKLEHEIYGRLQGKQKLQGLLLDLIQKEMNK